MLTHFLVVGVFLSAGFVFLGEGFAINVLIFQRNTVITLEHYGFTLFFYSNFPPEVLFTFCCCCSMVPGVLLLLSSVPDLLIAYYFYN